MSESQGVGVNGEPDDFAARYDRMLVSHGVGWVLKVAVAVALLLAAAGAAWSLVPLS